MDPLISCICITRGKPTLLLRAINCFLAQSYSFKELIVLYEDDDIETCLFFTENIFDASIKIFSVKKEDGKNLGALRNEAIRIAGGEYIAQWDDDDWYHKDRLLEQYKFLINDNADAVILTHWFVFDVITHKLYFSNERLWEGSILGKKILFQSIQYSNSSFGEDTPVILAIAKQYKLSLIEDQPHLYIYIYHGNNTWQRDHWELIFKMGIELPKNIGSLVYEIINYTSKNYSLLSDYLTKALQSNNILQ